MSSPSQMTGPHLGHIADFAGDWSWRTAVLAGLVLLLALALIVEHTYVKHGRLHPRHVLKPIAFLVVFAVASLTAPVLGIAQPKDVGSGLPDLISDPPFIWFNKDVVLPTGEKARVMAFDGYLHNIGTGPLDVRGNPQIEGDVKQRMFNGEEWEVVGTPPVQFETNDGHNHFHFMNAARYQLWNEARTEVIGDSSKVGFCLIDTEAVEEGFESAYDLADNGYCERNNPDATELFMGITPGWRDTYEANVTFQWVNTSNVAPGRYWVSAEVDPLNHIVESNEDNNGIVFSTAKYDVDGYIARRLDVQSPGTIQLKARQIGMVGQRAFVITEGPTNGSLNVPIGFDILDDQIRYTPADGFSGTDTFSYLAHDTTSPYPYEAEVVEVTINVESDAGDTTAEGDDADGAIADLEVGDIPELVTRRFSTFEVTGPDDAMFYASGLPSGLTLSLDGVVSGMPTDSGDFEAMIVAVKDGRETSVTVPLSVSAGDFGSLQSVNPFWSDTSRRIDVRPGTGTPGHTYEMSGIPAGMVTNETVPLLIGTPEETGTFLIEYREFDENGDLVDSIEFTWTVLGTAKPAFVL